MPADSDAPGWEGKPLPRGRPDHGRALLGDHDGGGIGVAGGDPRHGRGVDPPQPLDPAQGRAGLRLVFEDEGPGIPDINAAMRDGFSTGRSLGKGLPGSKRLVDVFEIESEVGRGTRVTIVRWL